MKRIKQSKNMRTFNNTARYDHTLYAGEVNNEPSETVIHQSRTIRELLQHSADMESLWREGLYDGNQDVEYYDRTRDPDFDLVDAQNMMQDLNDRKKAKQKSQETEKDVNLNDEKSQDQGESEAKDEKPES